MDHLDSGLLDAYAEGALDQDQKFRIEQHLAACPDCRKKLEGHRRLVHLASRLPVEPAPENLAVRVQLRLAQVRAGRRMAQLLRRLGWISVVSALAGIALLGSAWQQALKVFPTLLALLDGTLISGLWQDLANLSPENWPGWAQASLDWQTQLVNDVDIALLAGAILLSLAAFAGLARLLLGAQNRFRYEGED